VSAAERRRHHRQRRRGAVLLLFYSGGREIVGGKKDRGDRMGFSRTDLPRPRHTGCQSLAGCQAVRNAIRPDYSAREA